MVLPCATVSANEPEILVQGCDVLRQRTCPNYIVLVHEVVKIGPERSNDGDEVRLQRVEVLLDGSEPPLSG